MAEFPVVNKMDAEDDYKVALYQAAQVAANYIKESLTTDTQRSKDKDNMALKLLAIVEGTPLNLYRDK